MIESLCIGGPLNGQTVTVPDDVQQECVWGDYGLRSHHFTFNEYKFWHWTLIYKKAPHGKTAGEVRKMLAKWLNEDHSRAMPDDEDG